MAERKLDGRKFGGDRVLAKCEVKVKKLDPFSHFDNEVKSGFIVFNMRGGCIYLEEHISEKNLDKIFPRGNTTVISRLALSGKDRPTEILHDLPVKFVRLRNEENRSGIVIRFANIVTDHLHALERALKNYPRIGDSESGSIPLRQIFSLANQLEIDRRY